MSKTYEQAHRSIRELRGSAKEHLCACGASASDWAFQHTPDPLRSPKGRPYSENPFDYAPMCRSCHQSFDFENQESIHEMRLRVGKKAGDANAARWALDPDKKAQSAAGLANAARLLRDQVYARRMREENSRGGLIGGTSGRRKCLVCGKVSHPAGIGSHQKHSGHTGHEDVNS